MECKIGRYHILHFLSLSLDLSPHSEWLQWRKDVGAGTAAIEEVKKGSLEWMGSHREARGINNQS